MAEPQAAPDRSGVAFWGANMRRRPVTLTKNAATAFSIAAAASLVLLCTTAIAAAALGHTTRGRPPPHSVFHLRLDGRLAAAGDALCGSVHVSRRSLAELSCRALQQTTHRGPYPFVWQMTQTIGATLIATPTASPQARQRYAAQVYQTFRPYAHGRPFWTGLSPSVAGGLRYYDDNAWIGMDLMQAYAESHDRRCLRAAEAILRFQRTGEWRPSDPPDQRRYPGGIYWNVNRRFRPVNATAGTTILALELYAATHAPSDLALARREYQWLHQTLGTPSGLYRSAVDPDGIIIGSSEDNGEGFMIRAGLLLYQITHQKLYLNQAIQTAAASLRRFTPAVLEDTCPAYDASFLYGVTRLTSVVKVARLMRFNRITLLASVTATLKAYAKWVGKHSNPRTGVFEVSYSQGPCRTTAPQAGAAGALILQAGG